MWTKIVVTLLLVWCTYGAWIPCPEGSSCDIEGEHIESTSFEFLSKLSQKNYRSIQSLAISNASMNKLDPRLKYLKNLQYLDLSYNNVQLSSMPSLNNLKTLKLNGNNLKDINLTSLPQNIEILDISHNLLTQIPKDWRSLKSLKTLHLYKNPIDCDCFNVLMYERLIKSGVVVPETVTCHSPKKYIGKDIGAINCSLDDIMLYDEPIEGSGAGDIFESNMSQVPLFEDKENEEGILPENNTIIDDKLVEDDLIGAQTTLNPLGDLVQEEGSGDEGSGFGIILPASGILGCIENCSTPGPVGAHDEKSASPPPTLTEQMKTILEDLNILHPPQTTTTLLPTTSVTTTTTTTTTTTEKAIVQEPKVINKQNRKLETAKQPDKTEDVEVLTDTNKDKELERASVAPQNSNALYAIVGVGIFLAVVFLICFIKKRKSKRTSKHDIPQPGEEMKALNKPLIQALNEKPVKNSSNIPESIPLINGQNGKPQSDSPVLKSFTPLAHPELVKNECEDEPLQNEQDEVEFRPQIQPELLTPQRERVTIRESEIPDSIPKTPLLVQRQKNSEGEIVTVVP